MLLDSNLFIYAILPEYALLREWCIAQDIRASDVTRIEVLGYHRLSEKDKADLNSLFELASIYPISASIVDSAIRLRQTRKIKLGDSIIAATALEHRQTLATRNMKDFEWIEGLKVVDPLTESFPDQGAPR